MKVYKTPDEEIKVPDMWDMDREEYLEAEKKYIEDLKGYLKDKGYTEPEAGTILKFQVADGYAQYMVISAKKPAAYHLDLADAWEYPIQNYTASAFRKEIKRQIKFAELFK